MRAKFAVAAVLIGASATSQAVVRTVTDTGDAGDGVCDTTCTLRDAVNAAQTDDRIQFDLALPSPIVIGLTGAPLQIDVPLRMVATDGVPTIVRRVANNGRLLEVVGNGDARIIGVGFENGDAPALPDISADGGAIFVAAGAALELRDCVLRGNDARGATGNPMPLGPGAPARGGAIFAAGDLLVENCAFIDNHASGGDGAFGMLSDGSAGGAAAGGAIFAIAGIDIVNSTFSGNSAVGGTGGAGDIGGTGMPGSNGGAGGSARGGALAFGAAAAPTLAFSTLIANDVQGGAGGPGGLGGPPDIPEEPPLPNGADGAAGAALGAAVDSDAATIINVSVIAANVGASQCSGATLTARTSNRVGDASCPGVVVAALETQFQPIDAQATKPHYLPLFGSDVVDSAADCLDAVAFEAVDLDQLLTPRPLAGNGGAAACDFGAIELNPVLFADGFEEPPPPP